MDPVRFDTSDGISLEGELRLPEGPARGSAVLCHAHPAHGGSKDHPVLWALRNDLAARGLVVLAFNFRGNMGSEGSHAGGDLETEDVRAAVSRVRGETDGPTFVAGWSFGAVMALREAVEDDRVAALALLGFPLSESLGLIPPEPPSRAELAGLRRPVLLLSGEADQFSPVPDLRAMARRLPLGEVSILPGTDHFFWHREREAAGAVGDFAERALFGNGAIQAEGGGEPSAG